MDIGRIADAWKSIEISGKKWLGRLGIYKPREESFIVMEIGGNSIRINLLEPDKYREYEKAKKWCAENAGSSGEYDFLLELVIERLRI